METLSTLFGSTLRVKMIRLFLFNPETVFDFDQLVEKMVVKPRCIEEEVSFFKKLGLIKSTKVTKLVTVKKGKKIVTKKKKIGAWSMDQKFKYVDALTDFMIKTHSVENKAILKKIERAGRVKAVLVSGVFTRTPEARLDIFVVGDNIKDSSMNKIIKSIESDMGKDIKYAVLSVPDFSYRKSMNDKLVRDVFDYPHQVLLDKIGLPTK